MSDVMHAFIIGFSLGGIVTGVILHTAWQAVFQRAARRRMELVMVLARALDDAISNLGGDHSGHWDSTMQRGLGCPVCIREREEKERLKEVLERSGGIE